MPALMRFSGSETHFGRCVPRKKLDCTTIGGRVRAPDTIDKAHHLVRRAVHLGLYMDRLRERKLADDNGDSYSHRTALNHLVSSAYPDVAPESEEYQAKKASEQKGAGNGQNWLVAQE